LVLVGAFLAGTITLAALLLGIRLEPARTRRTRLTVAGSTPRPAVQHRDRRLGLRFARVDSRVDLFS
jgi:hypothetical protein